MPATRNGARGARKPTEAPAAKRPPQVTASVTKRPREPAGMLHIRIADSLKTDAATTLQAIGLTTSEAIRLFLHRVVVEQRLPLDLEVPNAVTRAAIEEARAMAGRPSRFATPDEMFDSLEDPGEL